MTPFIQKKKKKRMSHCRLMGHKEIKSGSIAQKKRKACTHLIISSIGWVVMTLYFYKRHKTIVVIIWLLTFLWKFRRRKKRKISTSVRHKWTKCPLVLRFVFSSFLFKAEEVHKQLLELSLISSSFITIISYKNTINFSLYL